MMNMGVMATINQPIDQDTAQLVVEEFGHTVVRTREDTIEEQLGDRRGRRRLACSRPPVVTIMGHVDHGKTSLLDYIRSAKVAAGEAGGITQHIGAYQVETPKGLITFIDTPGHAAFTAMRARGANVTDIVVLVVAADDGVMPQTIEAIQHARAADVPIVVAINKIDKPDADPDRVRNDLAKQNVIPEDWGGDTLFVHVSARTGEGIDELLETILLQAEVLDLKAPTDGLATGVVLESSIEKGRGAVATVLVQRGTLQARATRSSPARSSAAYARCSTRPARQVDEAGPALPVQVLGLSNPPNAGDDLLVLESERKTREVALYRQGKFRDVQLAAGLEEARRRVLAAGRSRSRDDQAHRQGRRAGQRRGVARRALQAVGTDDVSVKVIASGVGGITESDVTLAAASQARIIGFNVRADSAARDRDQGCRHRRPLLQHHLRGDRRREAGRLRHAQARDQGADRRSRAGARGVPLEQVRHRRRLPGHRRLRQARQPRSACCATTSSSTRASSSRCGASRTTSARFARAPNAASACATTTTCAPATRSSASRASRWPGRAEGTRVPQEFPRARRVAEQVQRVLGEMLRREVRDPRLKPVTVTHVKVSPDLSHAWIYYELLNGDSHDPLQREILDDAAVYLRGPVGRALRLR